MATGSGAVVFIYSDDDCRKCIVKGTDLLEQVARQFDIRIWAANRGGGKVLVDLEGTEITYITLGDNEMGERLSYIPTPLTVHLDSTNRIDAVHFSTLHDDSSRRNEFFARLEHIVK